MVLTATWLGTPRVKGSTESTKMALLTFSLIGIQFTWGTEMAYCTPYLLELGLTKSKLSLVWIAGPLSGLIMQPIVGILADKSTSKYGRRRPIMIGGSVVVSACLLVLGWTREIVSLFLADEEMKREATIALAVLSIYVLDFAINAVMSSCRSLIVDTLPAQKQQSGSAWASRLTSVGQLVGYGVCALDLGLIFGTLIGDTQFKQLCVVTTVALIVAIGITSWAVEERVLVISGEAAPAEAGVKSMLLELYETTRDLPPRIQAICWVQFWSFIAWFPFMFYTSTWVGEIYLRYEAPASVKTSPDTLASIGRIGSTSLIIFSIVTFAGSLTLPWLVQSPEDNEPSYTPRPPESLVPVLKTVKVWKPTLLTAWTASHLVFTSAMLFAPLVSSVRAATFVVALCGIPSAIGSWAPYTFMGMEINRLPMANARRGSDRLLYDADALSLESRPGTLDGDVSEKNKAGGELAGVYLGILNLYQTIPQLIATGISSIVFSIFEPGKSPELAKDAHPDEHHGTDGYNGIAVCLFIGALSSVGAAYAASRLRYIA